MHCTGSAFVPSQRAAIASRAVIGLFCKHGALNQLPRFKRVGSLLHHIFIHAILARHG